MPRRGTIPKREILMDPVYKSVVVTKLINQIMLDGKRGVAQRTVYDAFEKIAAKTGKDALSVFEQAMNNIMPVLEVKARRVGGSTYQVPIEIRAERRQTLGLRWLVNFARKRGERTMHDRLAGEILDASNEAGNAVKKKEDTHKMAEANRAFAHYRW
ncbi:MAG: 30S ribosomal protein S7 [Clostridiales bacterium]|nr:30S ribosomal protein S7 [Clostridiales bacterium]